MIIIIIFLNELKERQDYVTIKHEWSHYICINININDHIIQGVPKRLKRGLTLNLLEISGQYKLQNCLKYVRK